MTAPIRAVFFDLDDTLCNYMEVAREARKEVFRNLAAERPELSADTLYRVWKEEFKRMLPEVRPGGAWRAKYLVSGATTRTEVMRRVLARFGIEDQRLAARLSDEYNAGRLARLRLFPGAEEVLDKLSERFPMGLITNGPADSQREEIAALGIRKWFPHIFIEGEFGVGKPDPAIFHAAAGSVRVRPEELLFVGNALEHDIRGARRAGLQTCWLTSEEVDPDEADYVADSLTEIAAWIDERTAADCSE